MRGCAGVVGALLVVATASAQDKPPVAPAKSAAAAPDPMEAEVEAIHGLGGGKTGKDAIDAFLAKHVGDPRVLEYLPALESDLQKCLFRLSGRQPSLVELLGRGATKYESGTGRVEFKVSATWDTAGWVDAGEDIHFFDALFDGEVSVEMAPEVVRETKILLGFDSESRGGYAFVPVTDELFRCSVKLFRLDPGGAPVDLRLYPVAPISNDAQYVKYSMSKTQLTVDVCLRSTKDEHRVSTADDKTYRKGFLAVRGPANMVARGLVISGKLDAAYAKRQTAEADARRFREWRDAKWDRKTALPAWVRDVELRGRGWSDSAPEGAPAVDRGDLVALMAAVLDGPSGAVEVKTIDGLSGAAADWQVALLAFADRRYAEAETASRKVMEADPKFAAARVLAGRSLLARGYHEEALALFEEARRLDAKFAPAFDGIALAALRTGDATGMRSILAEEAAAGLSSNLASELRQIGLRVRRGPDWKKRFDSFSSNYAVSGDTSIVVCNDVAKILEEANDIYAKQFRPRPKHTRGRVRVFSGFDSYADYVSEIGGDPKNTLGMYMPRMRELCVFLHEDRPELSNTIRHEGFHQYLHDFLDDAPIWFNEGYAEYFGFSRRKQGKALVGQAGEEQAALANALLPKFTPVDKLFLMSPREFMADATVHYVEAWSVIHMLRDPSRPEYKGVLDRYFDALLAGRSQKQAYDDVLAPLVPAMTQALRDHVRSLAK